MLIISIECTYNDVSNANANIRKLYEKTCRKKDTIGTYNKNYIKPMTMEMCSLQMDEKKEKTSNIKNIVFSCIPSFPGYYSIIS